MRLPSRTELEELAIQAGDIALRHFRKVEAERKPDKSVVTQADREVEAFLAAELATRMPDAGILGEEGASYAGVGPYRVVIDPMENFGDLQLRAVRTAGVIQPALFIHSHCFDHERVVVLPVTD